MEQQWPQRKQKVKLVTVINWILGLAILMGFNYLYLDFLFR